jgi:hypothetical protein
MTDSEALHACNAILECDPKVFADDVRFRHVKERIAEINEENNGLEACVEHDLDICNTEFVVVGNREGAHCFITIRCIEDMFMDVTAYNA